MSLITSHPKSRLIPGIFFLFLLQVPLLLSAQAFNFEPISPVIVSGGTAGYGGAYSAIEAGFDTLTTNPAALAYVDKEWSVARLAVNVSGPLFDLPVVVQSDDMVSAILGLVGDNNGVYIGLNMTGPIAFGKVDRNFGFGVFNRTIASADIPSISRATVLTGEEILLVGGYGLNVWEQGKNSIAVGLQMKGFFQSFVYESGTAITVLNTFMDMDINGIPAVLSTGFGVDVGILYRLGDNFNAAVTCKDLYTPVFSTRYANIADYMGGTPDADTLFDQLPANLTAGVAYSIPLSERWNTVSDWKVMFDYRNALDILNPLYRNPVLNLAAGTELVLLDVVSLRAGISDTYLSTGLGLDLTVCQIDFAMYGTEMGLDPGRRPLLNMVLSAGFVY